ncbi:actin cytoskeleton protein [Aspergillus violaceofuscus CBS 115571]|uniref:Actin cytoskeleton protein n=1 Tax=Aspergillus violaceofuscus (strain CBS 115571) TaxID=1450538 RepID=A0A2V5HC81_ASPV1|nr:actin cytoskeleton protein [Aspergillus violaceofuscus CBS 115571]
MSERSTVHVEGIAPATTDKEVQDFFSFCGKITSISVTPVSGEEGAQKSATVTFEKEAAAKTALLLDHTQLGTSVVHVKAAHSLDDIAGDHAASASEAKDEHDHDLEQEDKPRSRIAAEYLAQGYVLSDTAIQKAIALDQKHGFTSRFTNALANFDKKYNATDKAKGLDENYKISEKASSGWRGLHSYFEKALETPSGRKLRDFYAQTDKQVRDIHNEARRLADLKSGKSEGDEHNVSAAPTVGAGAEGVGAAPATAAAQSSGTAPSADQKA